METMELNSKVDFKTFAIYSDCVCFIMFDMIAVRIGIANALELTSIP